MEIDIRPIPKRIVGAKFAKLDNGYRIAVWLFFALVEIRHADWRDGKKVWDRGRMWFL